MYCKKLNFFMLFFFLAGCQANVGTPDPVPAYATVKPGSQLVLNKPLMIPANRARVYFQDGNIVHENLVDWYKANCSLEIRTLKTFPQEIKIDTFSIQKISWDEEASQSRLIYASSGYISRRFLNDVGDVGYENYVTHFYLYSARQPDVFRLNCAHWEDPTDFRPRHLSVPEIQKAVGEYFSFKE